MYNWIRNAISTLSVVGREITPGNQFDRNNVADGKFSLAPKKKNRRLKSKPENASAFDTNRYFRLLTRFIYYSVLSWLHPCHVIYVAWFIFFKSQKIRKEENNKKKTKKHSISPLCPIVIQHTIQNHYLLKTHYLW